ncbi:MAG TPA: glycoside hydrolase family 38 C-terminal domain-containing protein, partial [Gemmatimonadales bacterium]|nr:glycoside hydrolase family 38 C-terminal domain-containing protein [Gemmatimonadales bacterium]
GRRSNVMYSPDAFGHPAQWPALAQEFGMRHGVIWRGLTPGLRDGDLFRWTGANGAAVLLYQLPREGYESGAALPADPEALLDVWPGVRESAASRASSTHVPVFIGADHHAAHPEPARLRELLARLEPDHDVRISSLEEFLQAAEDSDVTMPAIEGELRSSYGYTWTLQGVHGTRLPLKRRNARAELALERYAEPLAALALRQGGADRRPILEEAWRTLVQCHFHDSIAGCTHDHVAEEVLGRLRDASNLAREISRGSLEELAGHDPDVARTAAEPASALVVWNPVARPAGGVVVADTTFFRRDVLVGPPGARLARAGKGFAPFALALPDGRVVPVQVIEQRRALERRDARHHYPDQDEVDAVRIAFELPPVPGLALARLDPVAAGPRLEPEFRVDVGPRTLSNGLIDVQLGAEGTISLRDRGSGATFSGLLALESEPDLGDTYSFAPAAGSRPRRSRAKVTTRVLSDGPLIGILEARWKALDASFRLRLELRAGESFVRIMLQLDNRGTDRRLRARFPLGLSGVPAAAGALFGVEERAPVLPTGDLPAETPVRTAPAQRFISVANDARGLAILTPGHSEYELTPDGDILLTVLRSVGQLSREDLLTRPGHAGWPVPTPGAQCLGSDRLELALAPVVRHDLNRGRVHELWENAFLPPAARWLRDAGELAAPDLSVELDGKGLILSAVKPADDGKGTILRCYNPGTSLRRGRWRIRPAPRRAWLVRADESGEARIALDRGTVPISAGPGAIVTIRVD